MEELEQHLRKNYTKRNVIIFTRKVMLVKDFLQEREVNLVFALSGSEVEEDIDSGNKK